MVTVSQFPKHDVTPPPQKTIFHNEDIGDLVVFDGFFNCHLYPTDPSAVISN